jgi:hypothetical protein
MSEKSDWSPQYAAWRLFELVLEAEKRKSADMTRDEILGLFSECVSASEGTYTGDMDLSGFETDDEDEDDIYDDEDEDDDKPRRPD